MKMERIALKGIGSNAEQIIVSCVCVLSWYLEASGGVTTIGTIACRVSEI